MDLIQIMNFTWKKKQQLDSKTFQTQFVNLLSHSYVEIYNLYQQECLIANKPCTNFMYKIFEIVIIYLMKTDGDFLQGEFDAYVQFANYANQKPYSATEIRNWTLDPKNLPKYINVITNYRWKISANNYEALVTALCFLCLSGDKAIDENEYYILRCFFDDSCDYYPKTWEQFKKEW